MTHRCLYRPSCATPAKQTITNQQRTNMILKTIRVGSLIGLSIMSMMAMSVASASASELQGQVKALKEAVLEGGGGEVKCPAAGYEGKYDVMKTTSTTQPKWEKQEKSSLGNDLIIRNKFPATGCAGKVGAAEEPATVEPCELHVQLKTVEEVGGVLKGKANGSVVSACVIKTNLCEITVVKGKEIAKVNSELPEVKLENTGSGNLLLKAEVSGITTEVKGIFCPITASSSNKFKSEVEAQGVQILKADDF
jgi:hypothetical protein